MTQQRFDLGPETTHHGRQPPVQWPAGVSVVNGELIKHGRSR
ncbi:MAG: hypothetical protein R6W86_03980 [Marinobacter sp.]